MTEVVAQRSSASPITDASAAEEYIASTAFRTGPPRLVGVELEWLVHDLDAPSTPLTAERLISALGSCAPPALFAERIPASRATDQALGAYADPITPVILLPAGSTLTVEPGGQLEVSAPPSDSLADCITSARTDCNALLGLLEPAGLTLDGIGIDRHRPSRRLLQLPRYSAMEHYFERFGSSGLTMMCSSASVQVCVDAGVDPADRWNLLHQVGPVLVAMFANSAVRDGRISGWRSARQRAWSRMDPARSIHPSPTADPRAQYAQLVLDTDLLCVRRDGASWNSPAGVSFRDWIEGHYGRPPTYEDLGYHLTTMFPPVRAQGHLEVRYVDQQAGDNWVVPTAVITALLGDARAGDLAAEATEATANHWDQAARDALTDPALRQAALTLSEVVTEALPRIGATPEITASVGEFFDRYTVRGRCPADDALDQLATGGTGT